MGFTKVEREVIGLWIATGALDSMVNHIILNLVGWENPKEVHFETSVHQQLFNILLLDFLERGNLELTNIEGSCVELLEEICRLASFNNNGSVNELDKPLQKVKTW